MPIISAQGVRLIHKPWVIVRSSRQLALRDSPFRIYSSNTQTERLKYAVDRDVPRERIIEEIAGGEITVINESESVGCPEGVSKHGEPSAGAVSAHVYQIKGFYEEVGLLSLCDPVKVHHDGLFLYQAGLVPSYSTNNFDFLGPG